jgi:peptidyl-prolyl cis-trans isomerase A (cyclophilin A)
MKRVGVVLTLILAVLALGQEAAKQDTKQDAKQDAKVAPAAPKKAGPKREAGVYAVFQTSMGRITCKLFDKEAPNTVKNFIGLAEGAKDWTHPVTKAKMTKTPLYNGTLFHRVIPGFMIQGGDPQGDGRGNPGYRFDDEIVAGVKFDRPGRLAMANAGPNSNGSQFFITEVPTPHLDGKHTIFGQVVEGQELVAKIARTAKVVLQKVTILRVK